MTAAEKLISLSSISGCDTAANHFCSVEQNRVYAKYGLRYIPSVKSKMKYIIPDKVEVFYVPKKTIDILYIKSEKQTIKYVVKPTIKIVHKCKP